MSSSFHHQLNNLSGFLQFNPCMHKEILNKPKGISMQLLQIWPMCLLVVYQRGMPWLEESILVSVKKNLITDTKVPPALRRHIQFKIILSDIHNQILKKNHVMSWYLSDLRNKYILNSASRVTAFFWSHFQTFCFLTVSQGYQCLDDKMVRPPLSGGNSGEHLNSTFSCEQHFPANFWDCIKPPKGSASRLSGQ